MDRIGDAERLKRLYDERAPSGMSQAQFGALYDIGSQSMVSQYLTGRRPLNIEAVAKFAKGLRCKIHEISPDMAQALEADVMPQLGPRALKRAMAKMAFVLTAIFTIPPSPAQAASAFNITCASALSQYTLHAIGLVRRWWLTHLALSVKSS